MNPFSRPHNDVIASEAKKLLEAHSKSFSSKGLSDLKGLGFQMTKADPGSKEIVDVFSKKVKGTPVSSWHIGKNIVVALDDGTFAWSYGNRQNVWTYKTEKELLKALSDAGADGMLESTELEEGVSSFDRDKIITAVKKGKKVTITHKSMKAWKNIDLGLTKDDKPYVHDFQGSEDIAWDDIKSFKIESTELEEADKWFPPSLALDALLRDKNKKAKYFKTVDDIKKQWDKKEQSKLKFSEVTKGQYKFVIVVSPLGKELERYQLVPKLGWTKLNLDPVTLSNWKKESTELEEASMIGQLQNIIDRKETRVKTDDGKKFKVDPQTANAVLTVHKALNPQNQKKSDEMITKSKAGFMKFVDFAWKNVGPKRESVELEEATGPVRGDSVTIKKNPNARTANKDYFDKMGLVMKVSGSKVHVRFPGSSKTMEFDKDDVIVFQDYEESTEITELYNSSDTKVLEKIGFKKAAPGPNTYEGNKKDGPINILYGIPMRAGKWADVWVGEYKNAAKGFFMADLDGENRFSEIGDLMKHLKKVSMTENTFTYDVVKALEENIKAFEIDGKMYKHSMDESSRSFRFDIFNALTGKFEASYTVPNLSDGLVESSRSFRFDIFNALTGEFEASYTVPNLSDGSPLMEKLDKGAPVEEWIKDFIKSDAPQFEGKSKDERIKMALGAYYASQEK